MNKDLRTQSDWVNADQIIDPNQSVEVLVFKAKKEIVLLFQSYGGGNCITENEIMNITFSDNTHLELRNQSKYNCDAQVWIWLTSDSKEYLLLRNKRVTFIEIWADDKPIRCPFTEGKGIILQQELKDCN